MLSKVSVAEQIIFISFAVAVGLLPFKDSTLLTKHFLSKSNSKSILFAIRFAVEALIVFKAAAKPEG